MNVYAKLLIMCIVVYNIGFIIVHVIAGII